MPSFNPINGSISNLRRNWFDADRTIYQDCTPGYCRVVLSDGKIISDHTNAQTVIGGDGIGAWLQNETATVFDTLGRSYPGAALQLWDGQTPSCVLGAYALKTVRDALGGWIVVEQGSQWNLTKGDAKSIQLLGNQRAIWTEAVNGHYVPFSNFGLVFPSEESYFFKVCLTNGTWFLHQRISDGALVCNGKLIGPGANYFYADIEFRNNLLRIAWSQDPGDVNVALREYTQAQFNALPSADIPPVTPVGPVSPSKTDDGTFYRLTDYLVSDPSLSNRKGLTTQPTDQQNQVTGNDSCIIFTKFGNPPSYEMWSHDENWIYHLEDASGDPPYSFSDPRWYPALMRIGESNAFITGQHYVIHRQRVGCKILDNVPINRKMWVYALYPDFYWGQDLGHKPTVLLVYDNTDGIYSSSRYIEMFYLAQNAGWVRWEAYRSDLVYRNGKGTNPIFDSTSRTSQSNFYLLGGSNTQPALTGCVPEVCPHLPPITPPTKIGDNFMLFSQFDPTKVRPYVQLLPSKNYPGAFNVILPDGTVLSAQGDSRVSGTDGPWEAGEVVGNEVTLHDALQFYTYLIVPVDKVPH